MNDECHQGNRGTLPKIQGGYLPISPESFPQNLPKSHFYRDDPLTLPSSSAPYNLVAQATIDPDGVYSADYPPEDCRHVNDTTGRVPRKVVTTGRRVLTWAKVGTLEDIPNLASDAELDEIRELGGAYIEATYPVRTVSDEWPVPVIPPASAALDWLVSVLASFKIPVDSVLPFWLVFELNNIAGSLGIDRLMGVLPTRWFDRYIELPGGKELWEDVPGLSLTEWAPHAVIFVARHGESSPGPAMTLPAHELGHTYGLSVDARLKENWVCNIDWPGLGDLPCGAVGGLDEYKNEVPELQDGNPSRGYWIRRGDEPDAVVPLTDQAQCNSHCFMGNSPKDAHLEWAENGRWIDPADYSRLIDRLTPHPDPAVVYLSGMIASDDRVYLGPFYQFPEGIPDQNESSRGGMYTIRFVGSQGLLLEIGLPLNYNSPDVRRPLPITFFGFFAPFPTDTQSIQIWNRRNARLLAERLVSSRSPEIQLVAPTNNHVIRASDPWDIRWARRDGDGGILTTSVLMSTNGREWWPVAHRLSGDNYRVAAQTVPPGHYFLKLMVNDEIHVTETQPITLTIQP
jgi:hypothetical protein